MQARHCPQCGYDLIGQTKGGGCPECGWRYDAMKVLPADPNDTPWVLRYRKSVAMALLALCILIVGGLLAIGSARPLSIVLPSLVIASLPAFGAAVYWWSDRQDARGES